MICVVINPAKCQCLSISGLEHQCIFRHGQDHLGIHIARKLHTVRCKHLKLINFCRAGIILLHLFRAVKDLTLGIRIDCTSDKGKQEHTDNDNQSYNCQSVAEKPLCNHHSGGKYADTLRVIKLHIILLVLHVLSSFLVHADTRVHNCV